MTTAADRADRLERQILIHQRLRLKRTEARIAFYENWERAIAEGIQIGDHMPDDPPLGDRDRQQLEFLRQSLTEIGPC